MDGLYQSAARGIESAGTQQDRARLVYGANKVLAFQTLDATGGSPLISVPANQVWLIHNIWFHNTDVDDRSVYMRLVPSGATPGNQHNQFTQMPLVAKETAFVGPMEEVLESGYSVYIWADKASVVNVKVNGIIVVSQ